MSNDHTAREIAVSRIAPLNAKKSGPTLYLEVSPRMVWMRREHPDATIETELVSEGELQWEFWDAKANNGKGEHRVIVTRQALFRCRVTVPSTGAVGTGYGSESFQDFRDYIEKAETKAIGRALDALGYSLEELQFDGAAHPAASAHQESTPAANGRQPARPAAGAQPSATEGAKPKASDIADAWRSRIGDANTAADSSLWEQLVGDAGDNPWRWIEMVKHAPSLDYLRWLETEATRANQASRAFLGELERRRAVLKQSLAGGK